MSKLKAPLKILVIDDDPDILTIVQFALEAVFTVKCLSSAQEAFTEISRFNPDIILLDVMMPDMNGLSSLKLINKEIGNVPIILFTAKALSNELEYYKMMGAQGIITKPFDPILLPENILNIWENFKKGISLEVK